MAIDASLSARANDACELCTSPDDVRAFAVAPHTDDDADHNVLVCGVCAERIDADTLDDRDWFGLQTSAWSTVPAVKVLSWRLLHRLAGVSWASDLLEQVWLDDDERAWAESGLAPVDDGPPCLDSNGARLSTGDAVTLIKDLDVKGANFTAKRGTLVKNIRVTDDPGLVEGRVNGVHIVLKTEFLKRA